MNIKKIYSLEHMYSILLFMIYLIFLSARAGLCRPLKRRPQ